MSRIGDLLGVELPIIQAPMAGVQTSALAAAVSNAGGLGSLPCALLDHQQIRRELTQLSARTTKPYNVNFFCHAEPAPNPEREASWRESLLPYYRELGVDPATIATGPSRAPVSAAVLEILSEFRPKVVSFHFGLPPEALVARARAWGAVILASATTVSEARWLEERGVDAIIAQGVEAGGHRGMFLTDDLTTQIGTLALVPQICSGVTIPVIAAGGIADAKGVAAALALGAEAVQVGTAYLLCPEASTSAIHRAALGSEAGRHTALTNVFTGRPARGIVNRAIRELGPISGATPEFPLAAPAMAPLRDAAEAGGSGDFSPLWSGQNATGCRAVSAAEVTRRLLGDSHSAGGAARETRRAR